MTEQPNVSILIFADEAAAMIGIPLATLRFWIHKGEGPRSAKFGGRRMFKRADVLAWIEEQYERSQ